jgi:teichuronic acid biosynthesis glycosyltransferase TuaC
MPTPRHPLDAHSRPRVAVVAEFYPRAGDPVLGVWAHRQAVAARDAGAHVEVFVLHRVVPPAAALRSGPLAAARALWRLLAQPGREQRDGLTVRYLNYVSPARRRGYARWGRWAAPELRRALRRAGPFDVIHAHNAVPAGDAVLRALAQPPPLVVSIHGGDVLWTSERVRGGRDAVERVLARATLTLANSAGIEQLARAHGARPTQVLHLGADVPAQPPVRDPAPTLATVGHLVARKRHADVIAALAVLRERQPRLRYVIVGDGPERAALEQLARRLGVADRVEFCGALAPGAALARAQRASLFVMPSTEEAFGVAYIEAMAAGVPAIGAAGEAGPEEIAAAGGGIELVPAGDVDALATTIEALLSDPARLQELGERARETVSREFTWERCGERTLAAYREALARR